MRALKKLGEAVDSWDCLLIHLIATKLDIITKREWEAFSAKLAEPKISDVKGFLTERCNVLETLESASNIKISGKSFNKKTFEQRSLISTSNQIPKCAYCKGSHFIYNCRNFLRLQINDRYSEVKKLKLCTNCLRSGHFRTECRSSGCKRCQGKHSTFLHFENEGSVSNATDAQMTSNSQSSITIENKNTSISTHSSSKQETHVLLSTALIYVRDCKNRKICCRADSG